MRRLLWKEWHEVRWYLLVLMLSVFPARLYFNAVTDEQAKVLEMVTRFVSLETMWIRLSLPILIMLTWGITRNSRDRDLNRMSIDWMPTDPRQRAITKFMPGLIVCLTYPLWMLIVITPKEIATNPAMSLGQFVVDSEALLVAFYTLGYCFSLVTPALSAAVLTFCLVSLFGEDTGAIVLLVLSLLCASVVVYTGARANRYFRTPEYAPAVLLLVLFLIPHLGLGRLGGSSATVSFKLTWLDIGQPHYLIDDGHHAVAYRVEGDSFERSSMDKVVVWTPAGEKQVTKSNFAMPMVWLPDGNLLMESISEGKPPELLEWDRLSGKVHVMAKLPRIRRNTYLTFKFAWPNADGSQLALLSSEMDLWILDRKSEGMKLVFPGLLDSFGPHKRAFSAFDQVDYDIHWKGDKPILRFDHKDYALSRDGNRLIPLDVCKEVR